MDNSLIPVFDNPIDNDIETTIEQNLVLKSIEILNNISLTSTSKYQSPDLKAMFSPVSEFIKLDFNSNDDPNNDYRILQLYQLLLKNYHIYWDLKRLEFVNDRFKNGEDYLEALDLFLKKETSNPFSNLIAEKIALKIMDKNPKRAHEYLNDAINKHPDFKFNHHLRNIIAQIEKTVVEALFESTIEPNKKFIGKIEYSNLTTLYISVVKLDYLEFHAKSDIHNISNVDSLSRFIREFPVVYNRKIDLVDYKDYKTHSSEFSLDGLDTGSFLIIFSKTPNFKEKASFIGVTELISSPYFMVNVKENYFLYDAKNGNIKEGVPFKLYENKNNKMTKTFKGNTDNNGRINLPKNNYWRYIIELGNKEHYREIYHYNTYQRYQEKESTQFKLLTDRNLYRPGQIVYFKAIAYKNLAKKVIPNTTYTIILRDNNYQEKGRLQLKTNAFGSFSGQFELPKSGSGSGSFHIEILNHTSAWFQVEEYKLPKYKAEILEPSKAYKLNDPIELIGKAEAFAGYAIQNAQVDYTVVRKEFNHYDWSYWDKAMSDIPNNALTLASNVTTTDEKGTFKINFKAMPDKFKEDNTYYTFEVNATITDLNGEVRECSYSLTLSNRDRSISINTKEINILNSPVKINYELKSMQGKDLPFSGTIECYKVKAYDILKNERKWSKSDTTVISPSEFNLDLKQYVDLHHTSNTELIYSQKFENSILNEWIVPKELMQSIGEYHFKINTIDGNGKTISSIAKCLILPPKEGSYKLPKALVIYSLNDYNF
ncbi:MAG: MG2 domain-containing protein, partial [Candidatus Paceibacterota bacterium]